MSDHGALYLQQTTGLNAGRIFRARDRTFIGSQSTCDICVSSAKLAPMHACIVRRDGDYSLTDLTDVADVRVNSHLVKARKLMTGDVIDIAGTAFVVCDPAKLDIEKQPFNIVGDTSVHSPLLSSTPAAIGHAADQSPDGSVDVPDDRWQNVVSPPSSAVHAYHPVVHSPQSVAYEHRASNATARRWLSVCMVVGLLVAGMASYFVFKAHERGKLIASFETIMHSSAGNEDPQAKIDKLQLLRQKAAGIFPAFDDRLGVLIAELNAQITADKRVFEDLMQVLDRNAASLAAAEDFHAALALYREAPERWQAKIQDVRQVQISELQQKAESKRQRDERAAATAAAGVQESQAAKAFDPLVDLVLELLMTNGYASARMQVASAVADPQLAPLKSSLCQIDDMLKQLMEYEQSIGENGAAGVDSMRLESLAPAVQAVIQLKNNEPWLAERLVQADPQHIISAALQRRLAKADGEIDVEKQAMRMFYNVWKVTEEKPSHTIPPVEKATASFADRMNDGGRDSNITLCRELIGFALHYRNTAFGRLYAPLFGSAYSAYLKLLEQSDAGGSCGNGKILQSESGSVFAETEGIGVPPEGRLSVFSYKSVFFNPAKDGPVPVASRIHVHDQQPYRVLNNSQIVSIFSGMSALPVPGQRVRIDSQTIPGQQMFLFGSHQFSFADDFTVSLNPEWRGARETMSVVSQQLAFSSPRLRSPGSKLNSKAGASDLELYFKEIPSALISLSFEMQRRSPQSMAVIFGDFSFVLGASEGAAEGIYMQGNLVGQGALLNDRVGVTERVAIQINSKKVSVTVNETSIACPVALGALVNVPDRVVFLSPKTVLLDNVRFSARKAALAAVAGISGDNRELAVVRGEEPYWSNARPGQPVYFFEQAAASNANPVLTATVTELKDELVFCSVATNVTWSITNNFISMMKKPAVDVASQRLVADAVALRAKSEGVISWAAIGGNTEHSELTLEFPVRFPEIGYLYSVDERLIHPQSAELLGGFLGKGSRQRLGQSQTTVYTASSPILEAAVPMGGLMLSAQPVRPDGFVEVAGRQLITPSRGYTDAAANRFWTTPPGAWTLNSGMMLARDAAHPVSVAAVVESFPAGVQFDVNLSIEPSLTNAVKKQDWHHPVMFELFAPSRLFGVTFGMGTGIGDNGVSVSGRTASLLEPGRPMDSFSILPDETVLSVLNPSKGEPLLKVGCAYRIRIRRMKDAAALYVDGRRIAYVSHPHLAGDVQLRVVAPMGGVRLGPSSAFDLPSSCQLSPKEAEFGDFGYVLKGVGDQVLIDADTTGLQLNGTVSFMEAQRVSGERSQSVVLRRVSTGVVTRIGPRTATVKLMNTKQNLVPGMKVMTGVQPEHLILPGS